VSIESPQVALGVVMIEGKDTNCTNFHELPETDAKMRKKNAENPHFR
jgi:hypothetical protein